MAQTTGAISAKDVYVSLDSQDISGSSNKITISRKRDSGQTTTFDGDWKITTAGKQGWEVSGEVVYSETSNEGLDKLQDSLDAGEAKAMVVSPKGNDSGEFTYTGNVLITGIEMPFDGTNGDPVIVTFEGVGSGTLTQSTVATS